MAEDHPRPDPDELLASIQAEEQQQMRGKLKIFLGYAAGVGKTYEMLEEAHQRKAEGVDLVVACVETHGRAETEALLEGLEIIPRQQIEYRGVMLSELDLDAVLARRPQLVLVDELAHTNAPGSRHLKRYQDVEELLEAEIDVYTTLNVQHLESLNDVVAQITGITVRETVPDSVFDEAAEIELVDLPPDELLQRFKEGKVYVPEQAADAVQRFFSQGNLTALRELAMRRAAERVDDQMRAYMQSRAIPGPWPAADRLLVCVSPGSLGERLVRTARRLADQLDAEWFAVYVETPDQLQMPQAKRDRLARTLALAEELGAKVLTLPGHSVVATVMEYARAHNITKIIAARPLRARWRDLLWGSVVDRLLRQGEKIDVYVVGGETERLRPAQAPGWWSPGPWQLYLQAVGLVVAATLIGALAEFFFSLTNLVMMYLLAVVLAAVYLGRSPAILASLLSVLAFDFFFVPPGLTFAVSDTQYIITFFGLFVVGLVISHLTSRVREQAEAAQRNEAETSTLYALSRDLAVTVRLEAVLRAIINNVSQSFGCDVVILLPDTEAKRILKPYAQSPDFTIDENEVAVAVWAFQHGQPAGRGTDTLPAAKARYLPLKTARGVVGVMGVGPTDPKIRLTPERRRLSEAFAGLAALAIERAQLTEAARNSQLVEEREKLQTALLNSISHDLRTPLVTITGALSSLEDDGAHLDDVTRRSLIETAREEAERLNRLVGDLLGMSRIEAGAMKAIKELCDVQDVIGTALDQLSYRLDGRSVMVEVPADLPLVPMDFTLMVQALANIVDNAAKYSAPDSTIEIRAHPADRQLEIEVADRGIGIPSQDLSHVFDKFYRVQRPGSVSSTGLGLSICRGIVEAHGGQIRAENRAGGGTIIRLTLPLSESEPIAVGKEYERESAARAGGG